MSSDILARLADHIEKRANNRTPVDTGAFRRRLITGSISMPVWLHRLLTDAGWDGHIRLIELGERGVCHADPRIGWVSSDELRELAEQETHTDEN